MIVLSHRGLDLDQANRPPENSLDSFQLAAQSGFGIELDLQISRDRHLLIAHEADLSKWSDGVHKSKWADLDSLEIKNLEKKCGPLCWLHQVFALAARFKYLHLALHVKGSVQDQTFLAKLIDQLQQNQELHSRILIFDLKKDSAVQLRTAFPRIGLAPSVAHIYDIQRFQTLTYETLFTLEEALAERKTFDWIWLDEWDRSDANGATKTLYDAKICDRLRERGFRIAMISPELHRHEGHPDGLTLEAVKLCWKRILALKPDAICTDYPARLWTEVQVHQGPKI